MALHINASSELAFSFWKDYQMKIACAVISSLLAVTPALAQDRSTLASNEISQPVTSNAVTFTCLLQGGGQNGRDGYNITYTSSVKRANCSVTCAISKSDNSTYSQSFSHPVRKGVTADTNQWFDGEAAVAGAPLSNPKITSASCN